MATAYLPCRSAGLRAFLIVVLSAAATMPCLADSEYKASQAYEAIGDLAEYCLAHRPVSEKPGCWGYVLGVADVELSAPTICIRDHKENDRLKLADIVIRYLQASHDPFDLGAASVVQDVLEDHFPCHNPPERPDAYWSLRTLRKACDAEGDPDAPVTSCKAYIIGAVDTAEDLDAKAICVPNDTRADLLIDAVRRFIDPGFYFFRERASDPPDTPAALTLLKFLRKNFPCSGKH